MTNIQEELTVIRRNSELQTLIREHPEVEKWTTRPYAAGEINNVLAGLKTTDQWALTESWGKYTKYYVG